MPYPTSKGCVRVTGAGRMYKRAICSISGRERDEQPLNCLNCADSPNRYSLNESRRRYAQGLAISALMDKKMLRQQENPP